MFIQGEPGVVIKPKKGSTGVTINKTTCALIFGLQDEPVTLGECNSLWRGLVNILLIRASNCELVPSYNVIWAIVPF